MKVLKAGWLVDGVSDEPVADGVVLVDDGKVVYAGASGNAPQTDADAETIDLDDSTLLPGLIDCHSHPISFPRPGDPRDLITWSDHLRLLHATKNLSDALRSGITTLRDCGAPRQTAFAAKRAEEEGALESPRLLVAGRPICPTGGHGYMAGSEADGEVGVRVAARQLFKEGADFLKLTATGGGTAGTKRHRGTFEVEELQAAVDVAELHDSYATAHCHGIEGMVRCLDAGVHMLEHATFVGLDGDEHFDADIAKRMADQGTIAVPTVQIHGRWLDELEDKTDQLNDEDKALYQRRYGGFHRRLDLVTKLYEHGVEILMGSDAGLGRNYPAPLDDLGYGLILHIDAGLPTMDVIKSATSKAAEYLGISNQTGSLQPGKDADIIAVAGNPFQNHNALETTTYVMKTGHTIKNTQTD